MRLYGIKKLCPQVIILPSDYETYSLLSKRLFEIVKRYTSEVEEYSIESMRCYPGGMRLSDIKKLCPNVIILPSDYETYSLLSKRLFEIVRRYTSEVEEYSIDECFADLTGLRRPYQNELYPDGRTHSERGFHQLN